MNSLCLRILWLKEPGSRSASSFLGVGEALRTQSPLAGGQPQLDHPGVGCTHPAWHLVLLLIEKGLYFSGVGSLRWDHRGPRVQVWASGGDACLCLCLVDMEPNAQAPSPSPMFKCEEMLVLAPRHTPPPCPDSWSPPETSSPSTPPSSTPLPPW